ncbi:hypothetical protein ES703_48604 [subsurface metagenome]
MKGDGSAFKLHISYHVYNSRFLLAFVNFFPTFLTSDEVVFLSTKNGTLLTKVTYPGIVMIIGLGRRPGVNKSPTLSVW